MHKYINENKEHSKLIYIKIYEEAIFLKLVLQYQHFKKQNEKSATAFLFNYFLLLK